MKIIIPMSGWGKRFIEGGYKMPKPLIRAEGMTFIEHVTRLFPGEEDFIFICNKEHLQNTDMKDMLKRIKPNCVIISEDREKAAKKGPVYAVTLAFDHIRDDEPVVVNYCDFSASWDYPAFKKKMVELDCDGCVPSYIGFHPHLIGPNLYGSLKVDANKMMLDYREKYSFTENKMECYQSSGTYYFKRGAYIKKYFRELMNAGEPVNGEFYVSQVYPLMQRDGLKTYVYDHDKFLQWGTPEDFEEYLYWSNLFRAKTNPQPVYDPLIFESMQTMIPIGGEGVRFQKAGFKELKPLIKVSGKSMFVQTLNDLPRTKKMVFVCSDKHVKELNINSKFKQYFPQAEVASMEPKGPVQDCVSAESYFDPEKPLLVTSCDSGLIWSMPRFIDVFTDQKVDAAVWTFRHHASQKRSPQSWGWVKLDSERGGNSVKGISCKVPISDRPAQDHAIIGTFYFRKAEFFFEAAKRTLEKGDNINGVTHVDLVINSMVEQGRPVTVFESDKYLGWGTPDDYWTYEYWQDYFDSCSHHPYKKRLDEDFK